MPKQISAAELDALLFETIANADYLRGPGKNLLAAAGQSEKDIERLIEVAAYAAEWVSWIVHSFDLDPAAKQGALKNASFIAGLTQARDAIKDATAQLPAIIPEASEGTEGTVVRYGGRSAGRSGKVLRMTESGAFALVESEAPLYFLKSEQGYETTGVRFGRFPGPPIVPPRRPRSSSTAPTIASTTRNKLRD
jgi:hypothetical protein